MDTPIYYSSICAQIARLSARLGGQLTIEYWLGWVEMIRNAETILSHPKVDVIHNNNHNSENKFFIKSPHF